MKGIEYDINFCPYCGSKLISKNKEYKGQKLYECGASIHIHGIDESSTCRPKDFWKICQIS